MVIIVLRWRIPYSIVGVVAECSLDLWRNLSGGLVLMPIILTLDYFAAEQRGLIVSWRVSVGLCPVQVICS